MGRLLVLQDAATNLPCFGGCFTKKLLQMQCFTGNSHWGDGSSEKKLDCKSQDVKGGKINVEEVRTGKA